MTAVPIEISFELSKEELVLDGKHQADVMEELRWLALFADEEEIPRILTAAVLLFNAEAGTIGQCVRTAVIWERG